MMKYSPPPPTLKFVAISETAIAVGIVIMWPIRIIRIAPRIPTLPTANQPLTTNRLSPRRALPCIQRTKYTPEVSWLPGTHWLTRAAGMWATTRPRLSNT